MDKPPVHTMGWSPSVPRLARLHLLFGQVVVEKAFLAVPAIELHTNDGDCRYLDAPLEDTPAIAMEAIQEDKKQ